MCAILGILEIKSDKEELRRKALQLTKCQRHRGPDWTGTYVGANAVLTHERLAIVGVDSGAQPLLNKHKTHALAVNGEIYNHEELEKDLRPSYEFQTRSDCEVILALYQEKGTGFVDDLVGMFAFVLYDDEKNTYLIARDHMGIVPLYTGHDEHGNFYVSSEMKAIESVCQHVQEFPPGHLMTPEQGLVRYYDRPWRSYDAVRNNPASVDDLRAALERSVKSHLMSDVPYGVLVSGGLDSSVVAAVAKKFVARRVEDHDRSEAWWPQLHSFAIGLEGAPDLQAARLVADHIGSIHHEYHFTVQDGLDALSDVIYHLETFDVTTVRASTPMYLMARKIRAMGIKMVLSGEGADEVFGGYLYFHKAPDPQAFHEETVRKLDRLHLYDCLRANKSMAAWGVEARVPFLDKEFLDVAMSLNPEAKMIKDGRIEKQILRDAFADYLPENIVRRQKEQFSDGVGYSWIDSLKEYADNEVSDQQLKQANLRFPVNPPTTKEGYLYRHIFETHFKLPSAVECVPGGPSVACSTPEAILWDESLRNVDDPSGRAVRVHRDAYS
ncbi:MAG: asparagine synthase B [Chitinivibrionales bacterium]|nr:asparagine synthase B [Chitinivibrionales bacterium]